ncbi:MAG: hypothetical protein ACJ79E_06920 [Anaeromyxobacteraceae bacterium]
MARVEEQVMAIPTLLVTLALGLAPALSLAQDRPSESDLFGAPPAEAKPAEAQPAEPARPAPADDAEARLRESAGEKEDPLKLGGVLYLRSNVFSREGAPPADWAFTAPSITDVYLDVRPNDRVRGFALGRLLFDPTASSTATSVLPGAAGAQNPRTVLDQLWARFDIERTAFVTAGRQHVKWGVGRFWNPTDYLHAVRRDPLALFDDRTGTTMLRVHVPWERRGWNFYAVAIAEPLVTQAASPLVPAPTSPPAASNTLGAIGGGGRAELVLGGWELGLDAVAQRGIRPRFGIDLSGALGEVDVRGELGLRTSSDVPLFARIAGVPDAAPLPLRYAVREPPGVRPAAVLGAEWSRKYSDEDAFTVGAEYFYNANGYDDARVYPLLLAANAFTPFYLGRHYAALYGVLPRPGSWNLHTFTLSVLANLSDRSAVARLDWTVTLLTYLTLETYLQSHLGVNGGELRLGIDLPAQALAGATIPAVLVGAPLLDAGVARRLAR